LRSWWSPAIEAATEALADRTPEEAVLMQEEMNFKELGINRLFLLLLLLLLLFSPLLLLFFIIINRYKKLLAPKVTGYRRSIIEGEIEFNYFPVKRN
jgi:hypothetical protein